MLLERGAWSLENRKEEVLKHAEVPFSRKEADIRRKKKKRSNDSKGPTKKTKTKEGKDNERSGESFGRP